MTITKFMMLGAFLVGCGDCMTLAVPAPQVNVLDSAGNALPVDTLTWSQGAEAGTAKCQVNPGPCSIWILDRAPGKLRCLDNYLASSVSHSSGTVVAEAAPVPSGSIFP